MSPQIDLFIVFVYGTLKIDQPNHFWLTKPENGYARYICEGKTVENFPLVIGTRYNIPFLLDKRGLGHQIHGEVYEIDRKMLANLDYLENYPFFYDRELQRIDTEKGTMNCWLYILRDFPEKLLKKNHLESYSNTSEQPYCEISKRNPKIKSFEDLAY